MAMQNMSNPQANSANPLAALASLGGMGKNTVSVLTTSVKHYTPSRTLRSSDSKLLFVPRVRTCLGSCSFAVAAPTIWNSLPLAIRSSVPLTVFGANSKLSSIT